MKQLGFGLMRLPLLQAEDARTIDLKQLNKMVDTFIEQGYTYFDTAYMYHNGASEQMVKEAIVKRYPRSAFTIASKLPTMLLQNLGDQERIFSEQLERTGAGYFDYYLLHALDRSKYETAKRLKSFEFVARLKEQGLIKRMGFSFHDSAEVLDQILTEHPEMEFVQLQINYLEWDDPGVQSKLCHETACRHGKDIIIMEPVKGGRLANISPYGEKIYRAIHPNWSMASWALRYAAGLDNVKMVLSGMSSMQQLQDNISTINDLSPLNAQELAAIQEVAQIIRRGIAIPSTACRYCVEGCPQHIAIPDYFALYNKMFEEPNASVRQLYDGYVSAGSGKASDCIACGQCEHSCPQHLSIIEDLKCIAQKFEK